MLIAGDDFLTSVMLSHDRSLHTIRGEISCSFSDSPGNRKPGATVRYAGGPKVGRVESVQLDPKNPAQLDVVFSVQTRYACQVQQQSQRS